MESIKKFIEKITDVAMKKPAIVVDLQSILTEKQIVAIFAIVSRPTIDTASAKEVVSSLSPEQVEKVKAILDVETASILDEAYKSANIPSTIPAPPALSNLYDDEDVV